jgi:hypothetical protein
VERQFGGFTVNDATSRTGGQFFRVHQQSNYSGRFTNVATGKSFAGTWQPTSWSSPTQWLRQLGTSSPTTPTRPGRGTYCATRRAKSYRSVGNLLFEYEFDTRGESRPGGVILSEEFNRTSGRRDTFDADLCTIVQDLIG